MKIIIGGAGAVGTHLAKLFAREHHNITLIDEDAEKIESLLERYDILGQAASPTSIEALRNANASSADLVIGVTPNEASNLTCCMLASKMGAKKTVARVDTYEYILQSNKDFFKTAGIDSLILPEMIAAQEIVFNVQRSWIRQWWEPGGSDIVLMGVKVRLDSTILNIPLRDLCGPSEPYHIVAIKRKSETIIPHGNDIVMDQDIVYFMTTKQHVDYIRKITGKESYPEMRNIFIMGGGRTAVYAARLLPSSLNIKIIEKDRQRCEQLNSLINQKNVMIINGDGRDMALLEEENFANSQAFIALTRNSEMNIMACLAAQRMKIRKTVAMLSDMSFLDMAESLDLGTLINKQAIAAGYIYQMMLKADVTNVKSLMVANADVVEFNVVANSEITRKAVKDLRLPSGCTLGGLIRNGQGALINGNTQIEEGDHVVAICLESDLPKLSHLFS